MSDFTNRQLKILYIEENSADVRFIQEIMSELTNPSFELESVSTLAEALNRLQENLPDVILLDPSLPDSFGLETFTKVYQCVPSVPIILLTGFDDDQMALDAVLKGAQDYLIKDHVHGRMLSRIVLYAIERKRSEEALREIAQGVSSATGNAFFRALVQHMTHALQVECAYVAEFQPSSTEKLKTTAWFLDGKMQ